MTTIIVSILSSVLAPIIYGWFILKQIASSEKSNEKLMELLSEERNMMNARLGQISSNTSNIATALEKLEK